MNYIKGQIVARKPETFILREKIFRQFSLSLGESLLIYFGILF